MSVVNFDRDLEWVHVDDPSPTPSPAHAFGAPQVANDQQLYSQVGAIARSNLNSIASLATDRQQAAGICFERPSLSTHAVYRLRGYVTTFGGAGVITFVGVGIPTSFPLSATETMVHWRHLRVGGSDLNFDFTLALRNFGTVSSTDYSQSVPMFYLGFGNASGAGMLLRPNFSMSVQRVAVAPPEYESKSR